MLKMTGFAEHFRPIITFGFAGKYVEGLVEWMRNSTAGTRGATSPAHVK
jgi:hypothetical protein